MLGVRLITLTGAILNVQDAMGRNSISRSAHETKQLAVFVGQEGNKLASAVSAVVTNSSLLHASEWRSFESLIQLTSGIVDTRRGRPCYLLL